MTTQDELQTMLNTCLNVAIVNFAADHNIDEAHIQLALDDAKSDVPKILCNITLVHFLGGAA